MTVAYLKHQPYRDPNPEKKNQGCCAAYKMKGGAEFAHLGKKWTKPQVISEACFSPKVSKETFCRGGRGRQGTTYHWATMQHTRGPIEKGAGKPSERVF